MLTAAFCATVKMRILTPAGCLVKPVLMLTRGCESQPLAIKKQGRKGPIWCKPLMIWQLNRLGDPRTIRKIVPTEVLIAIRVA